MVVLTLRRRRIKKNGNKRTELISRLIKNMFVLQSVWIQSYIAIATVTQHPCVRVIEKRQGAETGRGGASWSCVSVRISWCEPLE